MTKSENSLKTDTAAAEFRIFNQMYRREMKIGSGKIIHTDIKIKKAKIYETQDWIAARVSNEPTSTVVITLIVQNPLLTIHVEYCSSCCANSAINNVFF